MRTRTCTIALAAVVGALVATAVPASAAPTAGTYLVQDGDFLYGIAGRAGVSIDALLQANDLKLESIIIPGQRLSIPAGGRVPAPVTRSTIATVPNRTVTGTVTGTVIAPGSAPAPTAPAQAASGQTYAVQSGDTIIGIAFRFTVTPDALMALNKLNLKSVIVPGQRLALPAGAKQPVTTGNTKIDVVIASAKAQIGKPYKFGYDGPDFFDCSGLVRFAFSKIGMALLHHTLLQKNSFPAVAVADLRAGDLVFFHDDYSHEGLWLGNNMMIEAPAPGMNVQISWVPTEKITGAVRPING